MSANAIYRSVVVLLWALASYNVLVCRGLFWDGAAFLVNLIDFRTFHDFYPPRAHVAYVTELPVLLALDWGVSNTRTLAMIQSAGLFALPIGLYHLALHRLRADPALLSVGMVIVAVVYLPTSFLIIGEYNTAFAAVTAAMAIVLTTRGDRWGDGVLLVALGALCLSSYEATLYFGPLVAAAILWSQRRDRESIEPIVTMLRSVAAIAFLGSAVVAAVAMGHYWGHPHFVLVRAAAFDFWQNLQFIVPLSGLGLFVAVSVLWPAWLRGWGPVVLIVVVSLLLVSTLWFRELRGPEAMLFPPSHYVARQVAGALLGSALAGMWILVAWRRNPPVLLATLREAAVGRRLATAMLVLVIAAAVPDVALTRLWSQYVDYVRGLVVGRSGHVWASDLPTRTWPYRLFSQEWTLPALSSLVRDKPGDGVVLARRDYTMNRPFDPSCGTLPRLEGYGWR